MGQQMRIWWDRVRTFISTRSALVDDLSSAASVLGAGAVVTTLAAVGVQGDLLPRLVRNAPAETASLVSVAIVAVLALLIKWAVVRFLALCVLGLVLVQIVALGVSSLSDREVPGISLVADATDDGLLTITTSASATSLRNQETMLIQVIGLVEPQSGADLATTCTASRRLDDDDLPVLDVLLWEESGPDQMGASVVESTITVPAGTYAQVCALVRLRERDYADTDDDRYAWGYRTVVAPTTSTA